MSNQPTENDRKRAEQIVIKHFMAVDEGAPSTLVQDIAAALSEARRVAEGHVRTPDGVDRKVLGELPITEDGVVIGQGEDVTVWLDDKCNREGSVYKVRITGLHWRDGFATGCLTGTCYSTRAAAESARDGGMKA